MKTRSSEQHPDRQHNLPRGISAGKAVGEGEALARQAAKKAGFPFESLLDWKVYPDWVVLIAADGRKREVPNTGLNGNIKEEA